MLIEMAPPANKNSRAGAEFPTGTDTSVELTLLPIVPYCCHFGTGTSSPRAYNQSHNLKSSAWRFVSVKAEEGIEI